MKTTIARLLCLALLGAVVLILALPNGAACQANPKLAAPAGDPKDRLQIVLLGKVYCFLKQPVINFFPGQVTSLRVSAGDVVRKGQLLATYRLQPKTMLDIHRRLDTGRISDLQIALAEMGYRLARLKKKRDGIVKLKSQDLLAADALPEIEQAIELLAKRRQATKRRLGLARRLAAEEKALFEQRLGSKVEEGRVPEEARVVSDMDGVVVWVNPLLRDRAVLPKPTALFQVGVMDPMLIRAQVHEIEAMRLKVGDIVQVSIEALPGRKFQARLSRMDWAPAAMTPGRPTYYTAEFEVPNLDMALREGLKCRLVLPRK